MRRVVHFIGVLTVIFATATFVEAQSARPQFRPAVLGSGPTSLVNQIDTSALMQKVQKNGAVMFCAVISKTGEATAAWTYRPMPGSEGLQQEVERRLATAKFAPAIYNYQPVSVLLYGTVVFSPAEGQPRLRIFLNQDSREFGRATDFIGPQPVFGGDSAFQGLRPPTEGPSVPLTAVVDLALKVDSGGNLRELRVVREDPPLLGFATAAMDNFRGAKFIPAFRDGDPADSESLLPVCYKPQAQ